MLKSLSITLSVFRLWWKEVLLWTVFNIAWLILQVPIVTGPLATAAMYRLAQRAVDEEYLELRHGWQALREMWGPAWKWGFVNLIVWVVIFGNFWAYWNSEGYGWTLLKMLWCAMALVWFTLNLFYWPFWLAQTDKRLRTTLRNSFLFVFKAQGLSLALMIISLGLITLSILLTLPLVVALMAWLALLGMVAVNEELQTQLHPQPEAVGQAE